MSHPTEVRAPRSLSELRDLAAEVALQLQAAPAADAPNSGGGSMQRGLPEDLRLRFIEVRKALFQRGMFDPVLIRFDTATGTQASTAEIAEQLKAVAAAL